MRAPLPVTCGPGDSRDLVVNVILRVAVAAGALQPRRHDQARILEPARFLAINPDTVIAGPGDPRPHLQVFQRGPVTPVQDLLELVLLPGPVRCRPLVPGQLRPAGVFPEGGMQYRDRLGERDGHVGVDRGLAGRPGRLPLQLDYPLRRRMRLSGPQPRQVISELGITAARPPQFVPCPWVTLLENRLIRRALHYLPGREAQCLCSRAPPPARRLPGLGSIDVVAAGAPLGTGPALVLPDVVQVVALGDGHDHGQQLPPSTSRGRGTDHDHSDECNGLRG